MASNFEVVLGSLLDFGALQLKEIEEKAVTHHCWLSNKLAEVFVEHGLLPNQQTEAVSDPSQTSQAKHTRRTRAPRAALDTVVEEPAPTESVVKASEEVSATRIEQQATEAPGATGVQATLFDTNHVPASANRPLTSEKPEHKPVRKRPQRGKQKACGERQDNLIGSTIGEAAEAREDKTISPRRTRARTRACGRISESEAPVTRTTRSRAKQTKQQISQPPSLDNTIQEVADRCPTSAGKAGSPIPADEERRKTNEKLATTAAQDVQEDSVACSPCVQANTSDRQGTTVPDNQTASIVTPLPESEPEPTVAGITKSEPVCTNTPAIPVAENELERIKTASLSNTSSLNQPSAGASVKGGEKQQQSQPKRISGVQKTSAQKDILPSATELASCRTTPPVQASQLSPDATSSQRVAQKTEPSSSIPGPASSDHATKPDNIAEPLDCLQSTSGARQTTLNEKQIEVASDIEEKRSEEVPAAAIKKVAVPTVEEDSTNPVSLTSSHAPAAQPARSDAAEHLLDSSRKTASELPQRPSAIANEQNLAGCSPNVKVDLLEPAVTKEHQGQRELATDETRETAGGKASKQSEQPEVSGAKATAGNTVIEAQKQVEVKRSMAHNLVSTIRSFLPSLNKGAVDQTTAPAAGKKPVKVKALEVAEAARRKEADKAAERAKQKQDLERQRAEKRAKLAEEARRKHDEQHRKVDTKRKKDDEALGQRIAEEHLRKKERVEDKVRKADDMRAKRKVEEELGKVDEAKKAKQADGIQTALSGAQHLQQANAIKENVHPTTSAAPSQPVASAQPAKHNNDANVESYPLSAHKSDTDSEDEATKRGKPIPEWARGKNLLPALQAQAKLDPDEVFGPQAKTCNLEKIFGPKRVNPDKPSKYDYTRRTSSSNWLEDRVTWKEELMYKKAMGYL